MYSGNVRGTPPLRSGGHHDFSGLGAVYVWPQQTPPRSPSFSLRGAQCSVTKRLVAKGSVAVFGHMSVHAQPGLIQRRKEYPAIKDDSVAGERRDSNQFVLMVVPPTK